jgi:hypothetical protein
MSLILNGHEIVNGLKVRFSTINSYDNVVWSGIVAGVVSYDIAKVFTDVDKYHAEVLKDNAGLDPANEQQYILINTVDDGQPSRKVAFAVQWIDESTLVVIDITNTITIKVYDIPDTDIVNVLNTLANAGFKAKYVG